MPENAPCPNCGNTTLKLAVRAFGWAYEYAFGDNDVELNIDNVVFKRTKTVRCADCNVIRLDAEFPKVGAS